MGKKMNDFKIICHDNDDTMWYSPVPWKCTKCQIGFVQEKRPDKCPNCGLRKYIEKNEEDRYNRNT